MSKLSTWFEKRQCRFIGWDYDLLKQCGEVSHRLLKIYTCAILIIMLLWFTIGCVFSQRYIGVSTIWGQILAGFAFSLMVFFVERIIILHIGSKGIYTFRLVLAISMALLGAFIFDQMIFRNDLEEAIRTEERKKLLEENNDKIAKIQADMHHLKLENDSLYKEIERAPTIPKTEVIVSVGNIPDSNGNKPTVTTKKVTQDPNPLLDVAQTNTDRILAYDKQIERLRELDIDKAVDERIKNKKTGFLEELKASLRVISESWISIVFYSVLFVVLLCLELFVVSLKLFKSKKCEYDMIVEHQLEVKRLQLDSQMKSIREKHLLSTLEKN